MTVDMTAIVEEAVVERASGSQVSRPKSLLAAAVAGGGGARQAGR
jgi:hypothetical protein